MSNPSWPQFARIPFDSTVAAVVRALGVEIPPEGRPRSFMGPAGFIAHHTSDGRWLVRDGRAARYVDDGPDEVRRVANLSQGTPSGDALRQWLAWWGWEPKKREVPHA
jgi:hypothetical protein